MTINPDPDWLEVRYLRTALGDHLLVRTEKGWSHLDPADGRPRGRPTEDEIRTLLRNAFSANPQAALSDAPSEAAKALVAKDLACPGGWRFYNPALVTRDGQEMWHRDNEIIFPREMVAEFGGDVDVATLMLWNLEQRGGIAPGQLRD